MKQGKQEITKAKKKTDMNVIGCRYAVLFSSFLLDTLTPGPEGGAAGKVKVITVYPEMNMCSEKKYSDYCESTGGRHFDTTAARCL